MKHHECLNNSQNSYVFWTTRLEFQKHFRDDWIVGDTGISPIAFPLVTCLGDYLLGFGDMPREMRYQSQCAE